MSSSAARTGLLAHARPLQSATSAGTGGGGGCGPYTAVFVVLGVIAALLVISCLVGQVCAKKYLRPRPRRDLVANYDENVKGGGYGHHPQRGVAKLEAPALAAATTTVVPAVEMRPVA